MKSFIPKTHLFTEEELPLVQFSQTFSACSVWLANGLHKQVATFDLFVRDMPANRNYLLFGGLEEIVSWIEKIRFTQEDINCLLKYEVVDSSFADYLKDFKFSGDVHALSEGTIFFPQEPIVRVTAPLIEAALLEIYLINAALSNTIFLSKACRLKTASQDKVIIGFGGMVRAQSFESGLKAARAGYLCGATSMPTLCVQKKYHLDEVKPIIQGQHLFIKSFSDELTAFRKFVELFPNRGSFMVDTYDIEKGINNAIVLAKELKAEGKNLAGIMIDSGDIISLTKYARKKFDRAGLKSVKISVATNMDEYAVDKLVRAKTPCDFVVIGTEYNTVSDSPKLEMVYKLAQIQEGDNIRFTAKLSKGKISLPGKKQVFRKFSRDGKIKGDSIGFEDEKLGKPLLEPYIKKGKIVKKLPGLTEIRRYTLAQLQKLPSRLKELNRYENYEVIISEKLQLVLNELKHQFAE